jgi:putative hemolysin
MVPVGRDSRSRDDLTRDSATGDFMTLGGALPPVLRPLAPIADRFLGLRALARVQRAITVADRGMGADAYLRGCLQWLELDVDLPAGDLDRVPATGPLLVVANHPTGAMEGILLLALLRARRGDVKVLANQWLHALPPLRELLLTVDVFGARGSGSRAMRAAAAHLRTGCLLLFPAGRVAEPRPGRRAAVEAPWLSGTGALQRLTGAPVLPVHVAARERTWLRVAGALHPHVRTLLLPRALAGQRRNRIGLRFGRPIGAAELARFGDDDRARSDYLRLRSGILERRLHPAPALASPAGAQGGPVPVAAPVPAERLEADLAALPPDAELLRSAGMRVLVGTAPQLPNVLPELGRLRELTFRGVGEGSGSDRDLDAFDRDYRHLFVWDETARAIVGAYRMGLTDELLPKGGPRALYTAGFYEYGGPFLRAMTPAIELGRSFVQPAYQKGYLPLLLLWRGIGAFLVRERRYRMLFGTVSISADHHATSVRLMVDHLETHCRDERLAAHVTPRRPWRSPRSERHGPRWKQEHIAELQDVAAMVRELEVRRQGVPVLLEQYLKVGARMVGINVDPAFHTIDALVVVDMLRAPAKAQQRYLGEDGAARLRAFHDPDVGMVGAR